MPNWNRVRWHILIAACPATSSMAFLSRSSGTAGACTKMLSTIVFLAAAGAMSASSPPVYVSREGFECLLRTLRQAPLPQLDPIEIDLSFCPTHMRAPRKNSMPDWSPPLQRRLVLTRRQTECLMSGRNKYWHKVDRDRYKVQLDRCK